VSHISFFYVILSLILLFSKYVCWPDVHGRQEISARIGSYTAFKSCVGFVDGTLFPLDEKPSIDSQDYYSRKGSYGLGALIVCDEKKRILYCVSGWPGELMTELIRYWSSFVNLFPPLSDLRMLS
jgi:hypothetical protein